MNTSQNYFWDNFRPLKTSVLCGVVWGISLGIVIFFPSLHAVLALGWILLAFESLTSFKLARYCAFAGKIGMMCAIFSYGGDFLKHHYASFTSVSGHTLHWTSYGIYFAMILGSLSGFILAKRTSMTSLPQLMALFHGLVGLGAASISVVLAKIHIQTLCVIPLSVFIEILSGGVIGAITCTGSVFAVLRLQNIIRYRPSLKIFLGMFFLALGASLASAGWFIQVPSIVSLIVSIVVSSSLGVLMILPVAGADMPLVISLLNSCSGWACVSLGLYANHPLLVVVGSIVWFSGGVLTFVMCKGMNRSLMRVFTGSFYQQSQAKATVMLPVQSISGEEAAFFLKSAERVVIIPGYGAAVAQAQRPLQELALLLKANHCDVKYGIHPVAGRMPGHMDILLAQANVSLEDMLELEEANRQLPDTDVVLIIGANDTVNPAAEKDPSVEIYGMPIFQTYRAKKVLFIKRSMNPGYSGIDNPLCYLQNTYMVFGDGKKVCEDILKAFSLL
ncbi:NAD(P)(+) transhydrogenase (Re/Si-specific) subunit beta [Holospora curviuscula]|nr:NAD(P)(+) transhydrogenase (Re/Si-specific) subunit beta [Holospora curviuscula]